MVDRWGSPYGLLRTAQVAVALVSILLVLAAAGQAAAASGRGPVDRSTSATAGPAKERPGPRGHRQTRRGIVQAVSARTVVLRQLDGTTLTVPVDARTRVLVDGRRAQLADVKPGFVAVAVLTAGKPAQELRTFSLPLRSGRSAPPPRPPAHSR
jgi:hypothetical protein